MLLYQPEGFVKVILRQSSVLRQRDSRLQPEFSFTVLCLHVHMHSGFFPREEIKAKTGLFKNGWAHISAFSPVVAPISEA
ncbi:hypothetical protein AYM39_20920 [Methylomonas sp. DH-1]|nr:hypothetical protein AYM39_20920 [Methylomonas sp. DH-1]